jgi:hypothetical protein
MSPFNWNESTLCEIDYWAKKTWILELYNHFNNVGYAISTTNMNHV